MGVVGLMLELMGKGVEKAVSVSWYVMYGELFYRSNFTGREEK